MIAERLVQGDRAALSKAITLIESKLERHHADAQYLLSEVQRTSPSVNKSFKIGISGAPGVGKSSFIDRFGRLLTSQGLRVAVIAVDPSSHRSGGSVLGDKTRMAELMRDQNAFIRPSPSACFLGGVTANAFETLSLCECAGYDVIIVETVGVGQSETQIVDLADMVLLLVAPGGGDDLQGIKRGIMEIADLVVVNKADGDMMAQARTTSRQYMSALHFMVPQSPNWTPRVLLSSVHSEEMINGVWHKICQFRDTMTKTNELQEKRERQRRTWMWKQVHEELVSRLYHDEDVVAEIDRLQEKVTRAEMSPRVAADHILHTYSMRYVSHLKSKTGLQEGPQT